MRATLLLALSIACNGVSSEHRPDAPPPDTSVAITCVQIDADFRAAIADGGTCATDADCDLIGGMLGFGGSGWTCDCAPAIGACTGSPIEKNAPGYARAQAD